ncbi:hypothetical protein [Kaistia adipata]|uniref:hypothetical protein n=1 Tax=Kaistia adipata TaxID=166954 RepID=UPI000427A027|nr:hypothetical protein [Kaistia adipata]
MQETARYIEDLSEQLSDLAEQCEFHDLAFLLKMASEEARDAARAHAPPTVHLECSVTYLPSP